jgi:cytoskeletal protein RodZ
LSFEFGHEDNIGSIGAYLKRVREHHELSLDEIQTEIKIHEKYLIAIENDDDSLFPNRVFKDLFVKAYASYLGVSLDEILLRMPELVVPPPESETLHSQSAKPRPEPAVRGNVAPVVIRPLEKSRGNTGRVVLSIALVIVIAILAIFMTRLIREPKPLPTITQPPVVTKTQATPEPVVKVPVVADSADSISLLDSAATADSTDSTVVVAPPEKMRMLLVGKGECWLGYRIDADTSISRMVRTNDTIWLAMQDSMYLRFGRLDNMDIWFNALPLRLGKDPATTVLSVLVNRDNYFQYVDSTRLAP